MPHIKIAQWAQINTAYLPLYIAIEAGFFKQYDIDAEIIPVGNDDEIFNAVASGAADFGVGDPVFCAMAENAKYDAKVIATIAERPGIWGITHSPVIQPIENIADLVNLRIGSFPRPSTVFALITELKNRNKRRLSSTQIIEAQIGQQIDLLARGDVDIALDIEPFISLAESKGYKVVHSFPDFHGLFSMTGLFTLGKTLDSDPELIHNITASINQALEVIHYDHALTLAISKMLFPDLEYPVHISSIQRLRDAHVWPITARTDKAPWKAAITVRKNIGEKFEKNIYRCIQNISAKMNKTSPEASVK